MKKKIAVLVAVVIALLALSMGCVEETTTVNIVEGDAWSNQDQKEVSVVKTSEKSGWFMTREKKVIIGRLTGVTFNYNNFDVLVFQGKDNKKAIFCANRAEEFAWIVGENYKVTIMESDFDSQPNIIDAEIINHTQTTQQAG